MNDNDVIKAFEKYRDPSCLVDVWYDEDGKRQEVTLRDVQDLINRLQAEIERLQDQREMDRIALAYDNLATAEQVEEIKNEVLASVEYNIKKIKSEARKEFAEMLCAVIKV